ncbi:MAG: HDOD domain-containing protein [Phycisphaerales bacterium]|nr:HDOD domain-containing protein [Phycisphaerales bacterium]
MRTPVASIFPTTELPVLIRNAKLPTMPAATVRILQLCSCEQVSIDEVADVVVTDPVLATRVLTMANSADNYRGNRFADIRRATGHLGLRQIRSLALTLHLFKIEPDEPGMNFDYGYFWRYCLTCGIAAKLLARQMKTADPEEAFLVGLLQDVGVLVLQRNDPASYGEVRREKALSNMRLYQKEMELLGYDHTDVGGAYADHLGLPSEIGDAIRHSHSPNGGALSQLCFLADLTHRAIYDDSQMEGSDAVYTLRTALGGDALILARMQVELPMIAEACACPHWMDEYVVELRERIGLLIERDTENQSEEQA